MFGHGRFLRQGLMGTWYCGDHNPEKLDYGHRRLARGGRRKVIKETVTITSDEAMAAAAVGALRQIRVIQKERQQDHGARSWRRQRDRWANQIHGAMGEIAFSKAINQAWSPGGSQISNGDVAGEYEVRATEMDNGDTCIFIYEGDLNDKWYVLAVGHFPSFHFPGAIKGKDGKQKQWWNENANPPCYWVPKGELTKITKIWGDQEKVEPAL